MRGGSFLDSADGAFNHAAWVSARMENSPDSGGQNVGFRCAWSKRDDKRKRKREAKRRAKAEEEAVAASEAEADVLAAAEKFAGGGEL